MIYLCDCVGLFNKFNVAEFAYIKCVLLMSGEAFLCADIELTKTKLTKSSQSQETHVYRVCIVYKGKI